MPLLNSYNLDFRDGLIHLDSVAGDHAGFLSAFPLGRRRSIKNGPIWWEAPIGYTERLVRWAEYKGLTISPQVKEYATQQWKIESKNMLTATAKKPDKWPVEVAGLKSTLLPHQQAIVNASVNAWYCPPGQDKIRHRAIIEADDQGLGKSITALAILAVKQCPTERTIIICPSSLTSNWVAEMEEHFEFGTFVPMIAKSRTPKPIPDEVDVVVIGWEILTYWADTLVTWNPDAVVADEGHYAKSGEQERRTKREKIKDSTGKVLKNRAGKDRVKVTQEVVKGTGSARADAALKIARYVAANRGLVMPMTGTPLVNRPIEVLSLIEFCGVEKIFGSSTQYKERYCGPSFKKARGRKVKQYNGATNTMELNTMLLTSGIYFRRTKEILVEQGLLLKKYVDHVYTYDYATKPRPWTIRASDSEMAEYFDLMQNTRQFFTQRAYEIAAENRMGFNTVAVREKVAAEGHKNLGLIANMRKVAAQVKIPYVIDQAQRLIDRGEKLVIVAHHREVVDAYAEAFTGLKIQGGMGAPAIEEAKALFNGTPASEHPVMVLSVEAGKTGHTLCKQKLMGAGPSCAYMIFAEQIWTPGDEAQAQDRIWRIGQEREVRISNALLDKSIDFSIYAQRQRKRHVFNAVVDSKDSLSLMDKGADKVGSGLIAQQLVYG